MPRENSPHPGVPTLDAGEKKFNSRLVAPTFSLAALRRESRRAFSLWGLELVQITQRQECHASQTPILVFFFPLCSLCLCGEFFFLARRPGPPLDRFPCQSCRCYLRQGDSQRARQGEWD